jgi:hypothetical protein
MNTIKLSVTKIALGAVTLITLSTLFANTASAARWAVAYGEFVTTCGDTPGEPCPKT